MSDSSLLLRLGLPFGAAAVLTAAATPLVRRLAGEFGIVARPKDDRWHRGAIPLLGGVAVWLGVTAATLALVPLTLTTVVVLVAGTGFFLLGLVDDLAHLKPITKLLGQVAAACVAVAAHLHLEWTGSPTLDALVSVFWIVGVANAFNLLDNMDGLCAGIAAIAAVALCFSVGLDQPAMVGVGAALAGAASAFLFFNFNPASIFMGDSGSLFVGGSLAILALVGEPRGQTGVISALAVPVLIMLIPIFDTTFVTVSRKLSARAASKGGRDHTSHRLVALGFSERQAVVLLYAFAAVGGATAVAIGYTGLREARIILALLLITLVLLAIQLARVKAYDGHDFELLKGRPFTPLLIDVAYKRRIFEVALDTCLVTIAYYSAYVIRFDKDFPSYYSVYVTSLPIVIACQLASFYFGGVYRGVWRYIGLADLMVFVKGVGLGTLTGIIAVLYLYRFENYSRGVFIIYAMGVTLLVLASRLSFRAVAELANRYRRRRERALIYGAGEAGVLLLRELRNNPSYEFQPMGFIDDDASKVHKCIAGVSVLGTSGDLEAIILRERPDVVIVSSQRIDPAALATVQHVCYVSGTRLLELDFRLKPMTPQSPSLQ